MSISNSNTSVPSLLDDDALDAAMNATSSPALVTPLSRKRQRSQTDLDGDEGRSVHDSSLTDPPSAPSTPTPGPQRAASTVQQWAMTNVSQLATRLIKRAKLRPDLAQQVDDWLTAPPWKRELVQFVKVLEVEQKLGGILVSQPDFQVSDTLDKNLKRVSLAVLLSTKLGSYRGGSEARAHTESIVDRRRFGMPPEVQPNTPEWSKVRSRIQYHQTQARSTWKKAIGKTIENPNSRDHGDIYALAKTITGGQCAITVQFCGRVAVMREVYIATNGQDDREFWVKLDARLKHLRDKAGGDQKKLNKLFKRIIHTDRELHGNRHGQDIEEVPQLQQQQQIDEDVETEDIGEFSIE